ncbi:MAG: transposase [Spirochaetales bacterium]|nr:transposase [Candidatus Physcosoma equi]
MIPEEISRFRPGPCTEIKSIGGTYYVYMYESVRLASGRWGKKTGKCIGKIIPDKGFVKNRNYHLYSGEDSLDDVTLLDYGQYGLIAAVAGDVRHDLESHFGLKTAGQIFAYASILYANGFIHLDQIKSHYEQSWLSVEYRKHSFGMGRVALSNLLEDIGRKGDRAAAYQNAALAKADRLAIDGHAIRCCSEENGLGEAGYKFGSLKEDQVNLLMGYDMATGSPVFSRMFRGSCNDKSTVKDLCEVLSFSNILLVVDRGFYSRENLQLFSGNGNSYIIPIPANTNAFKEAVRDLRYGDEFCYDCGAKHSRVEYMETRLSDTETAYVFRDIDENSRCRYNYMHCIELGKDGYTMEGLERQKENFGVYVLQSNSGMDAREVFCTYKRRWGIETFYQYLKNTADFNDLKVQDYCREQGLAFVMLVAGQIHSRMIDAVKTLNDKTLSTADMLLMARFLKMERKGNTWTCRNKRKKDLEMLEKLGFTPLNVFVDNR